VLRGPLEELLSLPEYEPYEDAWVQATLTDPARPADPMERLRTRFPHTLQLVFDPEPSTAPEQASYAARVSGRPDLEVAEGFVRHVRPGTGPDEAELGWLREAFETVRQSADREQELPG
jgi:exonuclease SbcD